MQNKTNDFNNCINRYRELNLKTKIPFDEDIIKYVHSNLKLENNNRLKAFTHNDFHAANIIINNNKYEGVIDFNRCGISDPYNEFNKLEMFSTVISREFSKGLINGYFKNNIPDDFWSYRAFIMQRQYSII